MPTASVRNPTALQASRVAITGHPKRNGIIKAIWGTSGSESRNLSRFAMDLAVAFGLQTLRDTGYESYRPTDQDAGGTRQTLSRAHRFDNRR